MDKNLIKTQESYNLKTQSYSYNFEFLARLVCADASFLTLREKFLFLSYLLKLLKSADKNHFELKSQSVKTDDPLSLEIIKTFEDAFLKVTLDDISFLVKRTFPRSKWTARESFCKVLKAAKIISLFKIKFTCHDFNDYPAMLREMKDPPFMIFYRGQLEVLGKKCISVVGTRRSTLDAKNAARDFALSACNDGACIVSGLAFGIDAAAHRGALLSSSPATCAVLPSGIDVISPQSHTPLAQKILQTGGLLISEYLPGTEAAPFRFVQRNRIVAALSPVTLVVQAGQGSGAMITAGLALDYNRELFFHSQCFSPEVDLINKNSSIQWKKVLAQETKTEYKMNNTPKAFVDDGAMVISDYAQFKKCLSDFPPCGLNQSKEKIEQSLFD